MTIKDFIILMNEQFQKETLRNWSSDNNIQTRNDNTVKFARVVYESHNRKNIWSLPNNDQYIGII